MPQPFDPREFFGLAKELANQGKSEARLRTAIGRAYYALLLLARTKTGVKVKRRVHPIVQDALKKRDGYGAVAQKLGKLERLRDMADYDLIPENPMDSDWERNWSKAQSLADDILPKLEML